MQLSTLFPQITPRSYPIPDETHKWDSLFGIELELENVTAPGAEPWDYTPEGWTVHDDASLRNGIEFVTARPYGADRLEEVIENFYDKNLNFTSGPRTSTHIHVNMSDATVEELRTMLAMVYTIEDAIYLCTEEARKWGGYSVALSEMRPQRLRNILNPPTNQVFVNNVMPPRNNERYYGFNCNISRHGTAEFRYFPGGPTQDELVSWVDLVALIKKASKNFTIQSLNNSIGSPHDLGVFLADNFGEWAAKLIAARSLGDMYSAFETVMALALDEENLERSGGVVHVTPSLMKYVEKTLLGNSPEAIEHLKSSIPRSLILGENDWTYYIQKAQQMVGKKYQAARNDPRDEDPYYDPDDHYGNEDHEEEEEVAPRRSAVMNEWSSTVNLQRADNYVVLDYETTTAPQVTAADVWQDLQPHPPQRTPTPTLRTGRSLGLSSMAQYVYEDELVRLQRDMAERSQAAEAERAQREYEERLRERIAANTRAIYMNHPLPLEGNE